MANRSRFSFRASLSFLLGLAFLSLPLRAQLDPKLQGSNTDFLNLYQQSTNTKVKPEILTIFDFSGSMESLMAHPLYKNNDLTDADDYRTMGFHLTPGVVGVPGNNTYTITAKAHGCPATYTTYVITVNSTGAVGVNTGVNCTPVSVYTIYARAVGVSGGYTNAKASVPITIGGTAGAQTNNSPQGSYSITQSNGTTTTNPITISPGPPYNTGSLTFTTYLATSKSTHTIAWSSDNVSFSNGTTTGTGPYKSVWTWTAPNVNPYQISNITTATTTFTGGSTVTFNASLIQRGTDSVINWSDGNGHTGTGTSWTWTVPAYDPGIPAADPYVTATLDPTAGSHPVSGITYLTSGLSSVKLVKPDGTLVTKTDAAGANSGSGLNGAGAGVNDVRNWVRAASHVRFATSVGSDMRTIDIPIPWKITNKDSTGNPLSSQTVFDRQVKTAADGTTTSYGSGTNIEMDQTYLLDSGANVLDGDGSTTDTTSLNTVGYRPAYISWLFNGKYAVGSYSSPAKYVAYDAEDATLAGGQGNVSWGRGYGSGAAGNTIKIPNYNLDGTYAGTETDADAALNVIPALSRVQAVKRAAIQTWVRFQADVIWAFRFLDTATEANPTNGNTIGNNSSTTFNIGSPIATYKRGCDSGWTVLNNTTAQGNTSTSGNSVTGMTRISRLFANDGTPLTYAMARGLAQFTDPASVFNSIETGTSAPSQCMNHFLILFTDGIDNNNTSTANPNGTTPYYFLDAATGKYKISAIDGNHSVIASPASLNRTGTWWNTFSFAGVAAHLADTSLGTVNTDYLAAINPGSTATTGSPSSFIPYAIYKRGTVLFSKPHLITTMTVGVSLGGSYTDATGPKRNLFLAAAVGDPTMPTWGDASTLRPFEWDTSLNSGNGGRVPGSIYFFDATNPDKLTNSLFYAIQSAVGASNINTASSPNTPFIGSALGGEILLGKFQPPPNGGAVWAGDLFMFGTKLENNQLKILNKSGVVTTTVDDTTAQWSALSALRTSRLWKNRTLYTRLPGTGATPEPGLSTFSDIGTAYTDSTVGLQNYVCRAANNPMIASYAAGSAAQQQVIQWAMGGDITSLDSSGRAVANRVNILGDIINSSPAILEYKFGDVSGSLTSRLSGVNGTRFRLILVGTNQGLLHAFGEVVKNENATAGDTSTPVIVKGDVDELWSFMPTDFLGYLDQLTVTNNPHRFMVDGAPAIYHLDLPSTAGASDGVVEVTSPPGPERAMVIFGLGKGGRSYYALDIHNPYTPVLKWSLVPDEATLLDSAGDPVIAARILARPGAPSTATVQAVIKNMGFSTCTPGFGRIMLTDSSGKASVRDAVFLGGGFSVPEVEANFLDSSSNPTPLGRSVLALDAYTGKILAAVDLSSNTLTDGTDVLAPGPVSRGVIPFEFILNSGMAQRAYFLDNWGGLWSWGNQKTDPNATIPTTTITNPYYQYRLDSSDLSTWTVDGAATSSPGVRLVAKDKSGSLITLSGYTNSQKYYSEALYTTLPAPFRVGQFTGKPKNTAGPVPATVGIALESGDKNNPLDYNYSTSTKPSHHRLSVVFDRQDSLAWGTVANPIIISPSSTGVIDAYPLGVSYQSTSNLITPGTSTYYLAPTTASNTKFGYYRNFPDISTTTGLIPKGINTPAVISGSLFYSYFTPTEADPCTGGNGYTYSNLICDVLNPIVDDSRTTVSCRGGLKFTFTGVASDYIPLGTRGVLQIGTIDAVNPAVGASKTVLDAETISGKSSVQYPKARVWRTVQ